MKFHVQSSYEAKAFNEGSDARIAGRPQSANPYPFTAQNPYRSWLRGWQHVDREWGKDCKVRPMLMDVEEETLPAEAEL